MSERQMSLDLGAAGTVGAGEGSEVMFTAEETDAMLRWQRSADECREAAAADRRIGLDESAAVYESLAAQYDELIADFTRTVAQARPGLAA